jgi:hypothetical protein
MRRVVFVVVRVPTPAIDGGGRLLPFAMKPGESVESSMETLRTTEPRASVELESEMPQNYCTTRTRCPSLRGACGGDLHRLLSHVEFDRPEDGIRRGTGCRRMTTSEDALLK